MHAADEPVIATFDLEPVLWKRWRCCTCASSFLASGASSGVGFPLALGYWLCGGSCREEELKSFSLYLTPTALHYKLKLFGFGCCCQTTTTKTIPLDKIQDVELISDCCGDTCGWVQAAGKPYKLHVQTAGMSGPEGGAELTVICVRDPEGLRAKVLAAKRGLTGGASAPPQVAMGGAASPFLSSPHAGGAGAVPVGNPILPPVATQHVVAVLERIERALNDGLAEMRSQRAPLEAGAMDTGTGAGKY